MKKMRVRAGNARTDFHAEEAEEVPSAVSARDSWSALFMWSYSRAQEGPIEGDLHGVASPGPGYLQSQLPEERESPHRFPVEPRPRGRCRYDEAGVRLDVESPPARQPYSQPVRIADRRYSPAHLPAHGRKRAQPGRVFPSDDHVAQSTKNLNDDAIGAAQATPRAPEPSVGIRR